MTVEDLEYAEELHKKIVHLQNIICATRGLRNPFAVHRDGDDRNQFKQITDDNISCQFITLLEAQVEKYKKEFEEL